MTCLNISIPTVRSSSKPAQLVCPKGLIRNNPSFDDYRPASFNLNLNLNLGCKWEQHWSTPPVIIFTRRRIGLSSGRLEAAPGPSSSSFEDEDGKKWVFLLFESHDRTTSVVVSEVIRDVYKQCKVFSYVVPSVDENDVKRIIKCIGRWARLVVNGLADKTKAKVASNACQLLGIPCLNFVSVNELVQTISSLIELPPPPQQHVETKAQYLINSRRST